MLRLIAVMTVTVIACSDALSPASLTGIYDVTVFELTNVNDTTQVVDLVEQGAVIQMGIHESGAFTIVMNGLAGGGTMTVDGASVTLAFQPTSASGDATTATGTISRSGSTVTLNLVTGIEFRFGSGVDEPARLRMVMVWLSEVPPQWE